jgi:LTXXQ motif family protein
MSNSSISWKAIGLVVVVFVLGIALGGVGTHLWEVRVLASQQHPDFVKQLKSELQLSPEQASKVDAILNDDHSKFHALDTQRHAEWDSKYDALDKQRHAEWDPRYDQVRQQGRDSIRAILTPDQKVKFEAFLKRLDEERQKQQGH